MQMNCEKKRVEKQEWQKNIEPNSLNDIVAQFQSGTKKKACCPLLPQIIVGPLSSQPLISDESRVIGQLTSHGSSRGV
jgi:hypothetical protein